MKIRFVRAMLVLGAFSILPVFAAEDTPLQVDGFGFTVERLEEGGQAFGNRKYVFREVPGDLKGLQFTRLDGGVRASLKVTCPSAADVHIVTAPGLAGLEAGGWEPVGSGGFHYTDKGRTSLAVFRRKCRAGETLSIPQGNWTGAMVVASRLAANIVEPKADVSKVPGVIICHSPASSGIYLGSPGIAVLPNGDYAAKCDEFGPGSVEHKAAVTRVYRSGDRGETWTRLPDVESLFWSSIFVHRGALYMLGTSRNHGSTVILKSTDGGENWTKPVDAKSGLLLGDGQYHCAPVPVVVHKGRLWRAMEDAMGPDGWGSHFRAFMMSAPADADLLDASNWTCSNRLGRDPSWLGGQFGGWLEGNAVVTPDGKIVNILRVHNRPEGGKAAVIEISDDGRTATFDPETGFIDFPGGAKKFTIRFDPVSKLYWSLSNYVPAKYKGPTPDRTRNTQALVSSPDLKKWTVRSILLYHPDPAAHGFQYVDWLFEGDDIIAASRTAYDDGLGGAHNQHDANFLTFHRFESFRKRTMKDSPPGTRAF